MTRGEIIKLLSYISSAYPNIRPPEDPKGTADVWEMSFGEYPADTIYKAVRFHIKYSQYWPTVADIQKYIDRRLYLAYETRIAIEGKAIEDEKVIPFEDSGCSMCPYLSPGQTEPCQVCKQGERMK